MKRTFSKDFKVKVCELVLKDGIKHAVMAEKMGINKIILYRWIDEYETHGEEDFIGKGHCLSLYCLLYMRHMRNLHENF